MKELITKNPDGTFTYDFHKFFTFDDAIMAEWKLNSPELDKAVLSKIMEKIYDRESFCKDGKGRQRPNRWDAYVEMKAKMLTSKREKCYCEELLEQYRNDNNDKEVVISGDSTFGPVIEMGISEDPWTKKRLYVYLAAYEEGSDYSEEYLKYCPFCGKKLTEITK
jgi:hypothetical protein